MRTAVYPGSFDPITNGHVDIVRRSLHVVDRVIVAVLGNPLKDSSWFTPEERVAMIRETFRPEGDRVVADAFSGLLIDYVVSKGANVIIRGLLLVLLGMIYNGLLKFPGWEQVRLPSVLGRIGMAYLFAGLIVLNTTHRGRFAW